MSDLFYRRLEMAETLLNLPPDFMTDIDLADWYPEFWRLVGEHQRTSKFSAEEKIFCKQLTQDAAKETNPVRRQYFALIFLFFGKHQTFSELINQNHWSAQLKKDFAAFVKWDSIVNSQLTAKARKIILHNRQISAFLQEKYSALLERHAHADEKIYPPATEYQIYFCWLQGEGNLPPVVRCCYNSLRQNAGRYKIIFLDEKNFSKYVDLAPHIMDKFRAGKISRAHFSDILRVNLLERYGGLWLDATILVTEPLENHENFWRLPYFTQKFLHAIDYNHFQNRLLNWCVSYGRWATFIQGTAILHNPLFAFEKDFYNEYWRDFDEVIDYGLMDFAMNLAYENIPFVKKEMDAVPINNVEIWALINHLGDHYPEYSLDEILENTFLHKLDWRGKSSMLREDSVFREIQRRYPK